MNPVAGTTAESAPTFSARLRAETATDHRQAERSSAMSELLSGRLSLEGYASLLGQLLPVYEALEELSARHRDHPVAGGFAVARLDRAPSLRRDLEVLPGDAGGHEPTPATLGYVDRLRDVGGDPIGFVAHHYTRYLGDLSGGIHIGRAAERHYGIDATTGSSFFHFELIEDPEAFKAAYRRRLDDAPWSGGDQDRFIAEVHVAYALNSELLATVPRG